MLRISEIRLIPEEPLSKIPERIRKKIGLKGLEIIDYRIVRESVDARKRYSGRIKIVCSADFTCTFRGKSGESAETAVLEAVRGRVHGLRRQSQREYEPVAHGSEALKHRPIIVGFGPCGMMAALILAEQGYAPIVIERGKSADERVKDVEAFWNGGEFNEESNVQFGEGGAGTFSDGKLTTQTHDIRIMKVLEEFAEAGAPQDILYRHKPHVGTDNLRRVVANIRKKITSLGGEVRFESKLTGIAHENGIIKEIEVNGSEKITTELLILAPGHSARDTFRMLYESGLEMAPKSFSIGVRIEHLQREISVAQYGRQIYEEMGDAAVNARLGAAEYKLAYHCGNGRGVYTFCMCPGGYVIGSSSQKEGVVTNGMSYRSRDGDNANSAILVSVSPEDFDGSHPLAGIEFQEKYEHLAFVSGGSNYYAPIQRLGDFLRHTDTKDIDDIADIIDTKDAAEGEEHTVLPVPTYKPGVKETDISDSLPPFAAEAIREAIPKFANKLKGFDSADALMTAVETRSSSPVRILRNEETESVSIAGIYPCGEGAGYAGGIMSSAVDGIKTAEMIIKKYSESGLQQRQK